MGRGNSTEELASLRPVDLSGAFSSLMVEVDGPRPLRVVPALGWWSGLHKKICEQILESKLGRRRTWGREREVCP